MNEPIKFEEIVIFVMRTLTLEALRGGGESN